jgi:hypothetical protein
MRIGGRRRNHHLVCDEVRGPYHSVEGSERLHTGEIDEPKITDCRSLSVSIEVPRLHELVLLDPVMQRLIAAPQAVGYVADAPTGEHQLDSLTAKLRRIRPSRSWHNGHPFASKPLKPFADLTRL